MRGIFDVGSVRETSDAGTVNVLERLVMQAE